MNPCVFASSVVLDAPVDEVFAFHGNPRNIPKIAPSWQTVRIIQADDIPRAGAEFGIAVTMFGVLSLRWRGRWKEVQPPALLMDEGLRAGPFARWEHRHEFRALTDQTTEMTDHVTYAFRAGWLGRIVGETFGRLQLRLMFNDRHRRTRRYFAAREGR